MNDEKLALRKSIYNARSIGYWSFVGIIVPLAGWILGTIALSKAKALDVDEIGKVLITFNRKTIRIAKSALILTTVLFVISGLVGGIVGYSIFQHAKSSAGQTTEQTNENSRDKCLAEASKLNVDVREQLPGEDIVYYWNYSSSVNYAEENARTDCLNRYGYSN